MPGEDRRVRRTKERLHEALMALIMEKGYEKTTVQDLIDRADVGRSTFYAHYETKDDLLISELGRLVADIEHHLVDEPGASEAILPSLGLFRHSGAHHHLFRSLIGDAGIDIVNKVAITALTDRALATIESRAAAGEISDVPAEARAAFAAGSLLAFLRWWLDNDMPHSPEEMSAMYRSLTAAV